MSSRYRSLKMLLGALAFIIVILVLLIANLASSGRKPTVISTSSTRRNFVRQDLDLNYVSKRRVPNGPDPIHNRGAGKSKRPPGRA